MLLPECYRILKPPFTGKSLADADTMIYAGVFPAEAGDDWDDRGLDELPEELPADFDPSSYIPGETDLSELIGRLDPYRDGFIDRDNPVIDGIDYES